MIGIIKEYNKYRKEGKIVNKVYKEGIVFFLSEVQESDKYCIREENFVEFEKSPHEEKAINIKIISRFVPVDTDRFANRYKNSNASLMLNKGISCFFTPKGKPTFSIYHKVDSRYAIDMATYLNKIYINQSSLDYFQEIVQKYYQSIELMLGKENLQEVTGVSDERLVIGLGNESVYKTSITLQHIYGLPYIPGQTIKGSVRNWIILNLIKIQNKEEIVDLEQDPGFLTLFGSKKREGKVIFFDAYPITKPIFKTDIINPHYSPYYNEGKPPADYYDPKPVFFLTVGKTEFKFLLGIKKKDNKKIRDTKYEAFKDKRPLDILSTWLRNTLGIRGIGAKTAVGYGYFKPIGT